MDPNTGYLTHQFMRTATSSLSPATRDLPLLGKDAPALVEDIVLESGKIVYYMQLETNKTRADEDLRKRASRRGKRAIRAMERMVQDLEDALLQDDDAPRAEKPDANESFADESLVEEDSCDLIDSDEEEEEYELSYFEDPDNSYIPTSPWLNGLSSSESLASMESFGSLFSSASTDSVSSSQMDEEEEERVGQRIEEFVVSAEARYPMTEDTYVLCFPALFRETPAPGVEASTAASADQEEEPEEDFSASTSYTYASAPPGLAVAVPFTHEVASAPSPAHRRATVDKENATPMSTAVCGDQSASGIALAAALEAVVAAHLRCRDGVASAASSASCGATANAQPSGAVESMLQVCTPRENKRRSDSDDEHGDDDHREEASEAEVAPDRASPRKIKKLRDSPDVDASAAGQSIKAEPALLLQGTGTSRPPCPPSLITLSRPLSPMSAPAPAERRPIQKRKRSDDDDDHKEDSKLPECDEYSRPAPATKKLKRTPASSESLSLRGAPVAARAARPLARARAPRTPHTRTTRAQTRAQTRKAASRPSAHLFTHERDIFNLKRDKQQARRVSADVTVLAMQAKVGRTRVANGGA